MALASDIVVVTTTYYVVSILGSYARLFEVKTECWGNVAAYCMQYSSSTIPYTVLVRLVLLVGLRLTPNALSSVRAVCSEMEGQE